MRLEKGRYLSPKRAQDIIEQAGQILKKIGMRVMNPEVLMRLSKQKGICVAGDRVLIENKLYQDFLSRQKQFREKENKHGNRLHGEASLYTYLYRDDRDGRVQKFTQESLAEYAAFVEKASIRYPVNPVIPGYPSDVPSELSSLARYKIAAENCSGHWPLAPDSVLAAEYMFEMAQVMGQQMDCLPVYMISPLTLGGDSFDIVMANSHRLSSFYVFAMPNMGITTPMNFSMGMATVLAEVAGGGILVEQLTELPGKLCPNLLPFDFRYFNIAFGSPEKFLYEQAAAELVSYIRGGDVQYSSTNIHTWGQAADGRTGIEKGMMVMAGAMAGAKRFYCVGTQSLDEVFDPLQFIQDLEAIQFAQYVVDGIPQDVVEDSLIEEMREGIQRGFTSSDRSLDDYAMYVHSNAFSPKIPFQKWSQEGEKSSTDILHEICQEIRTMDTTYSLDEDKHRELEKLFGSAMEKAI